MALDEAMMALAGPTTTTVRLYGWESACVSIGHFQALHRAVNQASCQDMRLPIVRRPTGGRAVLHDGQIAYAVICPTSDPLAEGKNVDAYRRISQILIRGLERLGTRPGLVPRKTRTRRAGVIASRACLQVDAQYELLYDGKKIGGSAQLRRGGTLLQHGFLMLRFDSDRTARALRGPGEEAATLARQMAARATSLSAALDREPTFLEVRQALADAFRDALGPPDGETCPSGAELVLAARLMHEKYTRVV